MRESYLLAAGLLTGFAIPALVLPHLSIILSENSRFLSNLKHGSQTIVGEKIIPSFDISLSEFSNQVLKPLKASHRIVGEKIIPSFGTSFPKFSSQVLKPLKTSHLKLVEQNVSSIDAPLPQSINQEPPAPTERLLNSVFQPSNLPLTSGNQLYYQRLAALKTGQIYTRADSDNVYSLWESIKKRQLTYQDWKSLLSLEAKAIAKGQGANHLSILLGDSLSMWFPIEKLPTGKLWLNQGISGDTSSGVLRRLETFSATRPNVIYILVGINDLRKGATDEAILQNHRRIIRSLRQTHPKTQIILESILPTRLATIPNSRIRNINTQLALIAKKEGASYLNIYSWFTDMQGNLRSELTTDGLHLSQEGYDIWGSALQQIEFKLSQRAQRSP